MALLFNDAASQFLEKTTGVLTLVPITMACWFFVDDATIGCTLMDLHNSGSTEFLNNFNLNCGSSGVPAAIGARTSDGVGTSVANTTANWSANTWQHACGVFATGGADRRAFLNGGNKGTNVTSRVPSGINRMSIGCTDGSTRTAFMSGFIADAAIWSVALADAEVALLATGQVPPYLIQRANLIGYWPLCGYFSPEINILNQALDMTLNAGPTRAPNPPIIAGRCLPELQALGAGGF